MYQKLPNLVFGFHGCDQTVFDRVVLGGEPMKKSENTYDWLGHGIYFWENSYQRALEWATKNSKIEKPAVIGAILDLGYCLNLTDYASSVYLRKGYDLLRTRCEQAGKPLPQNRPSTKTQDVLLRDLDCAVIQQIHDFNHDTGQYAFDSVRGIFLEGGEVYPGSEFRERTHVQLCIVNPNCIKGYFSPRKKDNKFPMP